MMNNDDTNNAHDDDDIPISGYLYKKNSQGKWQKRWFIINDSTFVYYKSNKVENLLGSLQLSEIRSIELVTKEDESEHLDGVILLKWKESMITLRAETVEKASEWIQNLEIAQSTASIPSSMLHPIGGSMFDDDRASVAVVSATVDNPMLAGINFGTTDSTNATTTEAKVSKKPPKLAKIQEETDTSSVASGSMTANTTTTTKEKGRKSKPPSSSGVVPTTTSSSSDGDAETDALIVKVRDAVLIKLASANNGETGGHKETEESEEHHNHHDHDHHDQHGSHTLIGKVRDAVLEKLNPVRDSNIDLSKPQTVNYLVIIFILLLIAVGCSVFYYSYWECSVQSVVLSPSHQFNVMNDIASEEGHFFCYETLSLSMYSIINQLCCDADGYSYEYPISNNTADGNIMYVSDQLTACQSVNNTYGLCHETVGSSSNVFEVQCSTQLTYGETLESDDFRCSLAQANDYKTLHQGGDIDCTQAMVFQVPADDDAYDALFADLTPSIRTLVYMQCPDAITALIISIEVVTLFGSICTVLYFVLVGKLTLTDIRNFLMEGTVGIDEEAHKEGDEAHKEGDEKNQGIELCDV